MNRHRDACTTSSASGRFAFLHAVGESYDCAKAAISSGRSKFLSNSLARGLCRAKFTRPFSLARRGWGLGTRRGGWTIDLDRSSDRATARDVITHRNQCKIHFRMANKTCSTNVRHTRTTVTALIKFLYKWMPLHLVYTIAMLVCEKTRR